MAQLDEVPIHLPTAEDYHADETTISWVQPHLLMPSEAQVDLTALPPTEEEPKQHTATYNPMQGLMSTVKKRGGLFFFISLRIVSHMHPVSPFNKIELKLPLFQQQVEPLIKLPYATEEIIQKLTFGFRLREFETNKENRAPAEDRDDEKMSED